LQIGPATFSLRHRFFSTTRDARYSAFETLLQPEPDFIPVNATKAKSRHYYDAAATFGIAKRFQLTVGVNNLFDTKPSLVGSQQVQANTDPSLYDLLGRRYFVAVNARLF
jgi:outer membrane receptor protein involved in Fe transport